MGRLAQASHCCPVLVPQTKPTELRRFLVTKPKTTVIWLGPSLHRPVLVPQTCHRPGVRSPVGSSLQTVDFSLGRRGYCGRATEFGYTVRTGRPTF